MNPSMSVMEGSYDEAKNELVMEFTGLDPATGKIEQMKSISSSTGDDKRNFVMLTKKQGEWVKMFEISYERGK